MAAFTREWRRNKKDPRTSKVLFAGDRPNSFRYRSVSSGVSTLIIPHDIGSGKWGRSDVLLTY